MLPDLAWGGWGRVTSVRYPPGWAAVAAAINADPQPVARAARRADAPIRLGGNGSRPRPLPRWCADVLSTGDLTIAGQTVPGEDRARGVQDLLLAGAPAEQLTAAGVGWVVAQIGSRGEMKLGSTDTRNLPVVYRDGEIALHRVGGHWAAASPSHRRLAVAAHPLAWLAVLAGGPPISFQSVQRWLRRPLAILRGDY